MIVLSVSELSGDWLREREAMNNLINTAHDMHTPSPATKRSLLKVGNDSGQPQASAVCADFLCASTAQPKHKAVLQIGEQCVSHQNSWRRAQRTSVAKLRCQGYGMLGT
jgi:hypothetical protein